MATTFASSSGKIVNSISSLRAYSFHGLNLTEEEFAMVSISSKSSLQCFYFLFLRVSILRCREELWDLLVCASRADRTCVPMTGGSQGHPGAGDTLQAQIQNSAFCKHSYSVLFLATCE